MPVGALVEAGEMLGIAGNSTRVALARLLADGYVARDERGRYRIGARARPVEQRVRTWRGPAQHTERWTGAWIGIHGGPGAASRAQAASGASPRPVRRARDRALRLLGFRRLTPVLAVRPANLTRSIEAVRDELYALGLPSGDLVFEIASLDPATEERARGLWDVRGLRATYRALATQLERSGRRLGRRPVEEAMVESFLLGGRVLRQLVLDPVLPDAICPGGEREALRTAMRRYDRLGRIAWGQFLARYDVPHLSMPADTRMTPTLKSVARLAS
jgi:phenylacetic acid degradation operon negative regulatory protein